jgi:integrase
MVSIVGLCYLHQQMANITNRLSACSSATVTSYITNISTMSESTAYQYFSRLKDFEKFIANGYGNLSVDNLLLRMKKGKEDPYNLLNSYAAYLKNRNISALTSKLRIVTLKNFFEYCDIDISPCRFKLKIKLRKVVKKREQLYQKKTLSKY